MRKGWEGKMVGWFVGWLEWNKQQLAKKQRKEKYLKSQANKVSISHYLFFHQKTLFHNFLTNRLMWNYFVLSYHIFCVFVTYNHGMDVQHWVWDLYRKWKLLWWKRKTKNLCCCCWLKGCEVVFSCAIQKSIHRI